jgi:hypothetical protein
MLNQTFELSCRVFSNMRENRMNTGDFHDLVYCKCFNLKQTPKTPNQNAHECEGVL